MKVLKYIVAILFVILHYSAEAQFSTSYSKVKYYYGDSIKSWVQIISCLELDNNYYFACNVKTDSLDFNLGVVKTDSLGNKTSNILFRTDSIAYVAISGNSLLVDKDSNIMLIGNYISNEWGGCITKMDKDLNIIWHQRYVLPDSFVNYVCDTPRHVYNAIKQDLDDNYIISGNYYYDCIPSSSNKRTFLMKVDSLGNIMWLRNYPTLGFVDDFEVLHDSSYIVSEHSPTADWSIIKLLFDGSIVWKKTINNGHKHLRTSAISLSSDSCILLAGHHFINMSSQVKGLNVIKMNPYNQNILWDKKFEVFGNFGQFLIDQHTEIHELKNKKIILFASAYVYQDGITGHKGSLIKLSEQGDSLWMKYYYVRDSLADCNLYGGFITNSGNLVAGGFYSPNANYLPGAWILKTDSMGNAPGMGPVISTDNINHSEKILSVYPNPVVDQLTVEIPSFTAEKSFTIEIYSIDGRLLMSEEINSYTDKKQISVSELSCGVYTLVLRANNRIYAVGKFVKE